MKHRYRAACVLGAFPVAVMVAACAPSATVSTNPAAPASAHAAKAAGKAHVGSTLDLSGDSSGEKMAVRVMKIIQDARGTQLTTAGHGKRLVAVQFRLTDIGKAAYSDAPDNSAVLIDSQGQNYQSDIGTVAGCNSFGGTVNIAPGASGLGCVVFAVPEHAKITDIQFTLDSGMASDAGQWEAKR